MTEPLNPPSIPLAALNFFAHQPDFPAIVGDLSEEFHQRVRSAGFNAATRWYWREAIRNAWALTARELLAAPLATTVVAVGCYLAVNALLITCAVTGLYFSHWSPGEPLVDQWIQSATLMLQSERSVLLLSHGIASLVVGWFAGRRLRGREWALVLTYTVVSACFALPGFFYLLSQDLSTFARGLSLTPRGFVSLVFLGNAVRLGGFSLGCLGSRGSRAVHNQAW